jgi:hypothetical protein
MSKSLRKIIGEKSLSGINLNDIFKEISDTAKSDLINLGKNGFEHSDRLEKHIDKLINNLKEPLNRLEAFVLLCSIYLHDIGYIDDDGNNSSVNHGIKSAKKILNNLKKYHLDEFPINRGTNTILIADIIAKICENHVFNEENDVLKSKDNPEEACGLVEKIRSNVLIALLRLADESDVIFLRSTEETPNHTRDLIHDIDIKNQTIILNLKHGVSDDEKRYIADLLNSTEEKLKNTLDFLNIHTITKFHFLSDPSLKHAYSSDKYEGTTRDYIRSIEYSYPKSSSRCIKVARNAIRPPIEMIKDTKVGNLGKILKIMSDMQKIKEFDKQIQYAIDNQYIDKYIDSWAEYELHLISCFVIEKMKSIIKKKNINNSFFNKIKFYDAGSAYLGQYCSFLSTFSYPDQQKIEIEYTSQDFNELWEEFIYNKWIKKPINISFNHLSLPEVAEERDCDIVSCAHALQYLGTNPMAIYSTFFSFNSLLRKDGICYIICPEKESQPGMLDLIEKSAYDSNFNILETGRSRLIRDDCDPPYNTVTFIYAILMKEDCISEESRKELLMASSIRPKYSVPTDESREENMAVLKDELNTILKEENKLFRDFKYIYEYISKNFKKFKDKLPKKEIYSNIIKQNIYKINDICLASPSSSIELEEHFFIYICWLMLFFVRESIPNRLVYNNIRPVLSTSSNARVDPDNLDDESVGRLIKHALEYYQSEKIDLINFFETTFKEKFDSYYKNQFIDNLDKYKLI